MQPGCMTSTSYYTHAPTPTLTRYRWTIQPLLAVESPIPYLRGGNDWSLSPALTPTPIARCKVPAIPSYGVVQGERTGSCPVKTRLHLTIPTPTLPHMGQTCKLRSSQAPQRRCHLKTSPAQWAGSRQPRDHDEASPRAAARGRRAQARSPMTSSNSKRPSRGRLQTRAHYATR